MGLGLLQWANMFNISLTPSLKLKVKAWGWISMRKSLRDASKNAFKETTMKNVPIDQFQNFKWRNGVQNRNICEKLSKIGHFKNFNYWSKVNAKVKVNGSRSKSMVSERLHGPGQFWVFGSGHGLVVEIVTSSWWRGTDLD